jgi:hypothetical protein
MKSKLDTFILSFKLILKASLINYTTMKPKDPIWNFYQIDEDSNKLTTRCKDCNATVSAKVLRMRSHREKCPSAARPAKRPLADLDPEPATKTSTPSKSESASIPEPAAKKARQTNMTSFSYNTDQTMSRNLDEQIAKLFFACNLPFNIADHPVFRETIQMLRPGYSPPNRKYIGGHLLDQVHEKIAS